jgi:hypothetical protein
LEQHAAGQEAGSGDPAALEEIGARRAGRLGGLLNGPVGVERLQGDEVRHELLASRVVGPCARY